MGATQIKVPVIPTVKTVPISKVHLRATHGNFRVILLKVDDYHFEKPNGMVVVKDCPDRKEAVQMAHRNNLNNGKYTKNLTVVFDDTCENVKVLFDKISKEGHAILEECGISL